MTKTTRNDRSSEPSCRLLPSMPEAFDDPRMSVDRFCLLAGLESLNEMMSARNLSTTLRHRRFLFTDSFLLLWKWRVG